MVLQGPPVTQERVIVLTSNYQILGELEMVGTAFAYVNDAKRESITLHDVTVMPLGASSPLKPFPRPQIILRRQQIVFIYFVSDEVRDSIRTLRRSELLVAYTPVAICKALFHMADEAPVNDFIEDLGGIMLPVTEAEIYPLIQLPGEFPSQSDLILLNRNHLQFYHPA